MPSLSALTPKPRAKKAAVRKVPTPIQLTPTQIEWERVKREMSKAERASVFRAFLENQTHAYDVTATGRLEQYAYPGSEAEYAKGHKARAEVGEAIRALLSSANPPKAIAACKGPQDLLLRLNTIIQVRPFPWKNELFRCPIANRLALTKDALVGFGTEGEEQRYSVAAKDYLVFSSLMNGWIQSARAHRVFQSIEDTVSATEIYALERWLSDNGYIYFRNRRGWYAPGVAEALGYDIDNPDGTIIAGYHHSRSILGHIPSSYDTRKPKLLMGLELEMECKREVAREEVAVKLMKLLSHYTNETSDGRPSKKRYAALEGDGSISYGFEMVTAYTGLDVHEKMLSRLKPQPFKGTLKSHDTTTCGLHVHIDRENITPLHADKLSLFINSKANRDLVLAVARRYGDGAGYAKIVDKTKGGKHMGLHMKAVRGRLGKLSVADARKVYHAAIMQPNSDRYQAVNFTPTRTIEYRLYRGTMRFETIMSCLEFTRASWLFTREASREDLTTAKFLEFICRPNYRSDTKYLRPYLTAKGFLPKERLDVVVPLGGLRAAEDEDPTAGLVPVVRSKYVPLAAAA